MTGHTETEPLKGCPFCGGPARIESNRDTHKLYADHAETCLWSEDEDPIVTAPATEYALTALRQCWNARATQASAPAVISQQLTTEAAPQHQGGGNG